MFPLTQLAHSQAALLLARDVDLLLIEPRKARGKQNAPTLPKHALCRCAMNEHAKKSLRCVREEEWVQRVPPQYLHR